MGDAATDSFLTGIDFDDDVLRMSPDVIEDVDFKESRRFRSLFDEDLFTVSDFIISTFSWFLLSEVASFQSFLSSFS